MAEAGMTLEEIIRMARNEYGIYAFTAESLAEFATIIAAAECEACAKIVEDYCGAWDDEGYALAAAIRARK
jgi:hypothetical protein